MSFKIIFNDCWLLHFVDHAKHENQKSKEWQLWPICPLRVREESEWEKHAVEYGKKRGQKWVECSHCEYATNKKSDMKRYCGRAKADTLKLTARVRETGSSLIPGLSRMLWVKQLLKPLLWWQRGIQRHPIPSTLQKLMKKRHMMQVEPAPLKHPMTSLRGNVLSANGFTSVQDCSVRVSLSSNGVNKRTRTLRCEQVEHTTQTEGQKKRLDRIVRKTFVICEFLKIVHFLFCFLYCL